MTESRSWLEQILANGLVSRDKLAVVIAENQEFCWIIAAFIKGASRLYLISRIFGLEI